MGRYIVLRLENTATAEKLLERFSAVPAIQIVGLFAAPGKFCEGSCDNGGKSIRSKRWGTFHCPICKLPKKSVMHHPRNLLQDENLHPKFADFFISVWEPFRNDPAGTYGQEVIDRVQLQVARAGERIKRSKRRKARHGG